MKHFNEQNYYELLEVLPDASLDEITKAYQSAQEAFNPDSVAIYSLFESDEEREELLGRIQEAYRTLSNGRTRREYDRQLFKDGQDPDFEEGSEEEREAELFSDQEAALAADPAEVVQLSSMAEERVGAPAPLPSLLRSEGLPLEVEPGEPLSGRDLVRLRESRGVSLAALADRIRVNQKTLAALEADEHEGLPARIYVKGFLKAYAQALKLDPEVLTEAYILGLKALE